jgi:hypothetical protein
MRIQSLLASAAIALMASVSAVSANAAIVNGSFESGLSGWTSNGSIFATTGVNAYNGTPYAATDGNAFAALDAGLGAGVYTTLSQSFTTLDAITVEGDAAFHGYDYQPFNDDAYVRVFDNVTSTTLFFASIGSVGNYGATAWTHFSTNVGPGSYTLEAGVRNNGDNAAGSRLIVDNLSVAAVPEPGAWALMLTGFVGAGVALRSNRRRQAAVAA